MTILTDLQRQHMREDGADAFAHDAARRANPYDGFQDDPPAHFIERAAEWYAGYDAAQAAAGGPNLNQRRIEGAMARRYAERFLLGSELAPAVQRDVLRRFPHRFTGDHRPAWARGIWKGGKPYPLQFASDADWLARARFVVKADGSLDERVTHCESSPTWPNNPELRRGRSHALYLGSFTNV
jgi:hypothetical protein